MNIGASLTNQETAQSAVLAGKASQSALDALASTVATQGSSLTGKALASDLTALTTTVNGKAAAADLTTLTTTVNGKAATADLTTLTTTVNGKAATADLTTLTTTVNGKAAASDLTALTTTVNGKAAASDLTALTTTVNGKAAASDLTALTTTVNGKAAASDLTALTTTVNNLSSASTSFFTNYDNISSVGFTFPTDAPFFTVGSGAYTNNKTYPITNAAGIITNYATMMTLTANPATNDLWISNLPNSAAMRGQVLIFQLWAKLGTATSLAIVPNNAGSFSSIPGAKTYTATDGLNATTYTLITHTFTASTTAYMNIHVGANGQAVAQTAGTVFAYGFQLRFSAAAPLTNLALTGGVRSALPYMYSGQLDTMTAYAPSQLLRYTAGTVVNPRGCFNPSTYLFTVPYTGYVMMWASCTSTGSSFSVWKNGAVLNWLFFASGNSGCGSCALAVAVGDTLGVVPNAVITATAGAGTLLIRMM